MESKLSTTVFFFLGFLVIVQAFPTEPEDFRKYAKCASYADCYSDGRQEMVKCFNNLMPEEVKSVSHFIEGYYKWKNSDIYQILKGYCEIDDAEQPNAFTRTVKGGLDYVQTVCADGSKKDECSRFKKLLNCFFGYLDKLNQQGECEIDA